MAVLKVLSFSSNKSYGYHWIDNRYACASSIGTYIGTYTHIDSHFQGWTMSPWVDVGSMITIIKT